jgi:nucleoside-diphosphate-sugar epimerase
MMKTVVTGACGFVGKHLCRALLARGDEVIGIDLKDGNDVLACLLPDADKVYHLAAQTDAQSERAYYDAQVNILGSLRVFEQYREKCVFASSSMVKYPYTPYAISKKACEDYARFYRVGIVRFCNLYGEGGHCVIDKFRTAERITINGSGQQLRTYAHVDKAVEMLLQADGGFGCEWILDGKDYTVLEIASWFSGKPIDWQEQPKLDMMKAPQI